MMAAKVSCQKGINLLHLFSRWFNRRRYLIAQADKKRDQGQPAEAAKLYQQIVAEWGETPSLLTQLGNALKDSQDYDKAYATYMRVWESESRNADVALQLGHLFKLQDDFDNSKKWYFSSIELDDGSSNPAHNELVFINNISDRSDSIDSKEGHIENSTLSFSDETTLRRFRAELRYRPS